MQYWEGDWRGEDDDRCGGRGAVEAIVAVVEIYEKVEDPEGDCKWAVDVGPCGALVG